MEPKLLTSEAADILGVTIQGIHKQIKSKGIIPVKSRNRIHIGHDASKVIFKNYITPCKVAVFLLVKGGVGKTTLCRETAIRSTIMGKKVLIIELDHQGNLTKSFDVDASKRPVLIDLLEDPSIDINRSIVNVIPGLDILPSRYDNSVLDNFIMLKGIPLQKVLDKKISSLKSIYDLILIDCPPSLGQSVASAVLCADILVLPTTPCDFSDSGIDITVKQVNTMFHDYDKKPVKMKIILNQYDSRERDSRETFARLIKHETYGDMLFNCYIRKCKDFERYRKSFSSVFDSTSASYAREDMDLFTRELLGMDSAKNTSIQDDLPLKSNDEEAKNAF